ncbi:MAG TPA: discoidin domain-containing protein [Acidimicrobiia bacterium]
MNRGLLNATLALSLAACSGATNSQDVEVRPFGEVQASEFDFELDPTNPSRGIFRVDTTEPMICAIVWGEDESLGNFNNSLNMAGTGIIEHDVFLPGAESGVDYMFVVQGTTADGALYRSEMATFSLPEPETSTTDTADRENLALDASITSVSSEFNDAFAAENAADGDLATEWSSAGDGDDASMTLDLGVPQNVSGFQFLTRSMTDGTALTETYTVTVDDSETLGPFPAGNPADPRTTDLSVTGQVFTFEVETSSGGNTGAIEIRILRG